jgi:dTDP-L-rhamnose 4-epimerase
MRVLVTGGAGFIGGHIAAQLLARGDEVHVLDTLLDAAHAPDAEPEIPDGARFSRADVRDADAIARALRDADAVCHQAAMVGLGQGLDDITDYVAHNDMATAVLLREMGRAGFRGPLVQASSMVVYGEGRYRCPAHGVVRPAPRAPADLATGRFEPPCPSCGAPLTAEPIPEDAPLDPRNVYAATKLHQEHLAEAYARITGATVTHLRYHNVYGPRMPRDTPYAGVAAIFRSAIERGEAPQVTEDGEQLRDFVHVDDVARANLLALDAGEPGPFNVCSGTPRSVGAMARALSAAGQGPDPVLTGAYRLGDVRHVFASPARARERLGFTAQTPFDAGMAAFASAPLRCHAAAGNGTERP